MLSYDFNNKGYCSMATIPIDKAEEGMMLEYDVKDASGRVLLHKGQKLQARHIEALRSTTIEEIDVVETSELPINRSGIDLNAYRQSAEEMKTLFVLTDLENDVMKEIFHSAVVFDTMTKQENGSS
jgi:hypothetical protein